ncbi:MAG: glycosyltransferase family 4 protein [Bacteroidetes bacterium]|nr:glycosyltransferase family 4 protein [Bacteroidota bacterium]
MTNLLIITYYWPPAGGPGVQRILKFVKYLPDFGIKPHILTVKNGDFPAIDETLVNEIPNDIIIKKVKGWEPYNLFRILTGRKKDEKIPVGILVQDNPSFFKKLLNWIRLNLFIPDARLFLIKPFIRTARKMISDYDIDCIISTGPPHSMHLPALWLKKKMDIKWIADFRDPWTQIYYYDSQPRTILAKRFDQWLEKRVLSKADDIITVSPGIARQLSRISEKSNVETIYNGYDQEDFKEKLTYITKEKFRITYVGNFLANQNIEEIWDAISYLINNNKKFASDLEIMTVGNIHNEVIETIDEKGLSKYLNKINYLPHREAVELMQNASSLLFIIPKVKDNKGIITGKLFDYLAASTPIIGIGPPNSDAGKILKNARAGKMINPNDEFGIKKRFEELYYLWKSSRLQEAIPNKENIKKFERKELTKKLAKIIKLNYGV